MIEEAFGQNYVSKWDDVSALNAEMLGMPKMSGSNS